MDERHHRGPNDSKSHWRAWGKQIDRSGASETITGHLAAWPPFHGVVASYLSMNSEVSVHALLGDSSIAAVVPRVEASGDMTMRRYESERLVRHHLGFDEPSDAAAIIDIEDIDVVLVPGLVFDGDGGRVGRGKGYYDHYLASMRRSAVLVGVTTEDSIVDQVPMDEHDVRVGWLATESGVRWVGDSVSADTERFMTRATVAGIAPNIERFPAGTRTSKDAARAVGCDLGAIAKSLVFLVDEVPVLVLCSGDRRVDEAKLALLFNASKARPASRERVLDLTGYPAGGTPAIGHGERLVTIADTALGRFPWVWSAGGSLDTVYEVRLEGLIAASGARWADVSMEVTR